MKKIGVFVLAAVTAFTSYTSAQAMPLAPVSQSNSSGIELVHHRPWHHGGPRHGWRGNDGPRYSHYNGYRGYRYRRDGYRRHSDGWWYPLAAFGAGMVIGGAIAAPPPPRRVYTDASRAHVDWCYAQYRSYRAYDNSFQPYYGPRQQCVSPYY
ncbi:MULTISPECIES: BA14K family protein [unclassified Sinorhizobium]|uniref:BA14K family protein n=1 Tax=unclassified Sinorhizobium TaxID=2613772 RepID=UPI0024C43B47|nr:MULTISPECIES: BA14K family protein [unclassified Sinorhizobium]MDK1372873.1 BA14K family protein [Sinorhizobium sp. 6-70]MDK1477143.1 BA14K family protein [Sinorhizobium sp. 6-117]MDK1477188.1 BA14K family protein [Sinorhizobium sp. 6-117]